MLFCISGFGVCALMAPYPLPALRARIILARGEPHSSALSISSSPALLDGLSLPVTKRSGLTEPF